MRVRPVGETGRIDRQRDRIDRVVAVPRCRQMVAVELVAVWIGPVVAQLDGADAGDDAPSAVALFQPVDVAAGKQAVPWRLPVERTADIIAFGMRGVAVDRA